MDNKILEYDIEVAEDDDFDILECEDYDEQ